MLKILLILFLSTTTIYAENKNFIKLITDCSNKVQNNYADNEKIPNSTIFNNIPFCMQKRHNR